MCHLHISFLLQSYASSFYVSFHSLKIKASFHISLFTLSELKPHPHIFFTLSKPKPYPRIMAKLSSEEKNEAPGVVVTVCFPALIRSGSCLPGNGKGPRPSTPFSLWSCTSIPEGVVAVVVMLMVELWLYCTSNSSSSLVVGYHTSFLCKVVPLLT